MCAQTLDRPPPTRSKRRGRPPGASGYQEPIERLLETYLDELVNDGPTWFRVLATDDGVAVLTALMAPAFAEELAGITDPEERSRRRRELRRAWVHDARDVPAKAAKQFRGVSIESRRKTLRNYWRGRPGGKRSRPSAPVTIKLMAQRLRHALEVLRSERELLEPDGL
jgi:hypothetical protein